MRRIMPDKKNFWTFVTNIQEEQAAKEIEQNQILLNDAVIIPLTKVQKNKERRLARYKIRYVNGEYTPLHYVEKLSVLM